MILGFNKGGLQHFHLFISLFHIESYTLVEFKNIWDKGWRISRHKFLEMQLYQDGTFARCDLDICWKGEDHAGPELHLSLLTYTFLISFYDIRHWNAEENRWYNEGEENWDKPKVKD